MGYEVVDYGNYGSRALASIVTAELMPDTDVSERTQRTYQAGAYYFVHHLIDGNWDARESQRPEITEFLSRVIANAARQGFEIGSDVDSGVESTGQERGALAWPDDLPEELRFIAESQLESMVSPGATVEEIKDAWEVALDVVRSKLANAAYHAQLTLSAHAVKD